MKNLQIMILLMFAYTEALKRAMTEKGYYFFASATKADLLAIAKIADFYFGSEYWENRFEGRLEYFSMLFEKNPRVFNVLWYYSPYHMVSFQVGYTSILPEKRRIMERHLNGKLDEYRLSPNDILDARTVLKQDFHVLYVQAVAILPHHRKQSKEIRDKMLADHLTRMMKKTPTQRFSLFAESSSIGFDKFAVNHGFYDTTVKSPHQRKILRFDSTKKGMVGKGRSLVQMIRKIQKRTNNH